MGSKLQVKKSMFRGYLTRSENYDLHCIRRFNRRGDSVNLKYLFQAEEVFGGGVIICHPQYYRNHAVGISGGINARK